MSSRLTNDNLGRLIAEGTSPELRGLRWLVIGDTFAAGAAGVSFLAVEARAGRLPNGRERTDSQRHAPYRAGVDRSQRERQPKQDDANLADEAAIELARREEERIPIDLISRAVHATPSTDARLT